MISGLDRYLVNRDRYEEERAVQTSKNKDYAMPGDIRDGFLTGLITPNRYDNTLGGVKKFLDTDWATKLNNTFLAIHNHYWEKGENDEYNLKMPANLDELQRVARLFRETYAAYFVWSGMHHVEDGYSATAWHYLVDRLEDTYFMATKWGEFMTALDGSKDDKKLATALWDVFMDRVHGRSDRFNMTDYTVANSALTMLEDIYWNRDANKRQAEYKEQMKEADDVEVAEWEATQKEVEDYLNGTNNSR